MPPKGKKVLDVKNKDENQLLIRNNSKARTIIIYKSTKINAPSVSSTLFIKNGLQKQKKEMKIFFRHSLKDERIHFL